jgi:hypothetical protein
MQNAELFQHEKQKNDYRAAGDEEILPQVPQAPGT